MSVGQERLQYYASLLIILHRLRGELYSTWGIIQAVVISHFLHVE